MDEKDNQDQYKDMREASREMERENQLDGGSKAKAETEVAAKPVREFLSIVFMIAGAFLLAVVLVNYVFQSYRVDGESMHNSLQHNDRLIIWKAEHTLAAATGKHYVPNRGDVVVFRAPSGYANVGVTPGKQLIKRVIGLPGERIVYKDSTLTVYNQGHPNGFNPDRDLPYGSGVVNSNKNSADITLGANQVYVLGDNRANSVDSRSFNELQVDDIVGKLAVRFLPASSFKLF